MVQNPNGLVLQSVIVAVRSDVALELALGHTKLYGASVGTETCLTTISARSHWAADTIAVTTPAACAAMD
jgi:hypothetical protein